MKIQQSDHKRLKFLVNIFFHLKVRIMRKGILCKLVSAFTIFCLLTDTEIIAFHLNVHFDL